MLKASSTGMQHVKIFKSRPFTSYGERFIGTFESSVAVTIRPREGLLVLLSKDGVLKNAFEFICFLYF